MSKKSNQKTASPKAEAVDNKIETKAQEPAEVKAGQDQREPAADQAEGIPETKSGEEKPAAPKTEEVISDGEEETPPLPEAPRTESPAAPEAEPQDPTHVPASPVVNAPTDLANRLTKAVKAIVASGNPEAVHALHKLEMTVGDLKNALPAAIAAAGDEQLKADLTSLLAVL